MSAKTPTTPSREARAGLGDWTRGRGAALTVAGLLMAAGGLLHPRADTGLDYDAAVAGMLHDVAWPAAHTLTLVGAALLAGTLAVITRGGGTAWPVSVRYAALCSVVGACLGVVEMVPHLLAFTEVDALESGGSTPLLTLHIAIQYVSAPVLGLSLAALAVVSSRGRWFGNGGWMAVLAVVGGVAYAAASVLVSVLQEPALSPLFAGAAGFSVWLIVAGIRAPRASAARAPAPAEAPAG